ncbi:MAG: MBOAT family protein [Lachnospiraceae bacterium]|nr:MBOAT family protein [Lachnospiraceae bacterium]
MLFPSEVFIWVFLPLMLILYYCIPKRFGYIRNSVLLIGSLAFYAWGEPVCVVLMIIVILIDYLSGMAISFFNNSKNRIAGKWGAVGILTVTVISNLGILGYYKYSNFTILQLNRFLGLNMTVPGVILPIGISFFTFQGLSYVFDVYRGSAVVQKNPAYVALYISFFPQLIAGPIVRYTSIADQIYNRREDMQTFSRGVVRFSRGLIKKVIIANNMAVIADASYGMFVDGVYAGGTVMAWLGTIAYSLQIFYDFSGYSDMAIGLGAMFGFDFPENFNYPYIADSITDFWRRWHISLSSWFRDYVYIPMGGSRVGQVRLLFNLFVVWMLTGIWHGANWTFIAWGLMYFILLAVEKLTAPIRGRKPDTRLRAVFRHIYTLFFVNLAWVIFRSDNLGMAKAMIKGMMGLGSGGFYRNMTGAYIIQWAPFLILGIAGAMPVIPALQKRYADSRIWNTVSGILVVAGVIVSMTYIVNNAYSPFIYFNF